MKKLSFLLFLLSLCVITKAANTNKISSKVVTTFHNQNLALLNFNNFYNVTEIQVPPTTTFYSDIAKDM